ncbi:hypothetical protein ABT390_33935 [Streptomyces aurantiacus]|uniref:Putative Cuticle collagen 34 n=1 Tax=Streptomyces aurantiacus JA 4570 TaxID=1286094 RepID=S3ZTV9_9ACTN|nr:hypothetical protein [Streptomyces aurantiacus]EPH46881.1 putative Cuticle collagen 34 [Streptomyces aurantiacus JA 4570]
MRPRTVWEIDVPMKHRQDDSRTGVHVFTGLADNASEAVASAVRACEIARLHAMSSRPIPAGTSRVDWSARGLRPDWELCWDRAQKKQIVL